MHTKGKQVVGALIATTLILGGCSWFGGNTPTPSSQESAAEVLRTMQAKLQNREMKSGNITGTLAFDFSGKSEKSKFGVTVDTDFDVAQKGEEKVAIKLAIQGDVNSAELDGSGSAKAELLVLEKLKTLYVQLTELQVQSAKEPQLQTQVNAMVQQYIGQWWKFPLPEGSSLFNMETSTASGSKLTPEQEAQVKELIKKTDFFTVTKEYGVEKVNGVDAYHYGVELNVNNLLAFVKETAKITGEEFTADQEQSMREGLGKVRWDGEVWVGVNDKFIYQGKLNLMVNDPQEETQGTITGSLSLNPNKTVNVQEPAGAKEFQFPGMMGAPEGNPSMRGDEGVPGGMMAPTEGSMMENQ